MKTVFTKFGITHLIVMGSLLISNAQTSITGFSPKGQLIGSPVTITGVFGSSVNGVFFGSTKQSSYLSKTNSQIVCNVPSGASFDYISVLDQNGYGISKEKFVPRFAGNNTLTAGNFTKEQKTDVSLIAYNDIQNSIVVDLNNDGKNDIVNLAINNSSQQEIVIRQAINFGTDPSTIFTNLPALTFIGTEAKLEVADITNDGLPELLLSSLDSSIITLTIFKNISSGGVVSFNSAVIITVAGSGYMDAIATGDFNIDGKKDLVLSNNTSQQIIVLQNNVNNGILNEGSFNSQFAFNAAIEMSTLAVSDLDGDGMVDIVATCGVDTFYTYLNNSSGAISFVNTPTAYSLGTSLPILGLKIADIDGDSKNDIIALQNDNTNNGSITFLQNISTIGDINIDIANSIFKPCSPSDFALGDLDGDGKPDLVIANNYNGIQPYMNILRNTALLGVKYTSNPLFSSNNLLNVTNNEIGLINLAMADFNNDGKPELMGTKGTQFGIFGNEIGNNVQPIITSLSTISGIPGSTFTIFGQNFLGIPNGSVNISNNVDFAYVYINVISDTQIDAQIDPSYINTLTGKVVVSNGLLSGSSSQVFSIVAPAAAVITSISSSTFAAGDTLIIIGSKLLDVQSASFSSFSNSGVNLKIVPETRTDNQLILYVEYCDYPSLFSMTENLILKKSIGSTTSTQTVQVISHILPQITNVSPKNVSPTDNITLTGTRLDQINSLVFPHNYSYATFEAIDKNTIVAKVPNFGNDTSNNSGTLNFYYCSTQGSSSDVVTVKAILPTITGFTPTQSYAGAYVTVFGQNLQYATHFKIFEDFQNMNDATIIEAGNTQTVIKLDNYFTGKNTQITGNINSYYSDNTESSFYTQSSVKYTILPYPKATITGFSPTSILPFEDISITGSNFDYIDNVELPGGYPVYSYEIISPNLIIAKADLNSSNIISDFINVSYSYQPGYTAYSTDSLTVNTFSGVITSILVDKPVYNSNEKLYAHATFTGILPPSGYAYYSLNMTSNSIPNFGQYGSTLPINSIVTSTTLGVLDFELNYGSLNQLYFFPTFPNYKVQATVKYSDYYFSSPQSAPFTIKAVPEFNSSVPFYPAYGKKDEIIILFGYNFQNASITGVFFNNTIPAQFDLGTDDDKFIVTIPGGNIDGKIRITYVGGEIISDYDFNKYTDPICDFENILSWTILNGSKYFIGGDTTSILASISSQLGTVTITSELSDENGDFTNPNALGYTVVLPNQNLQGGVNSSTIKVPFTIPDKLFSSNNYAIRIKKTDSLGYCVSFPIINLTIFDSASVTNLKIVLADTTELAIIDTIYGTLQLRAQISPDNAQNKIVNWSVSNRILASVDSTGLVSGIRNGTVTVFAVSKSNPAIKDSIAITLTNQYEPVIGMSIFADDDSTDIFPKAFEIIPINAGFIPSNATNQRYKLQLIQSGSLIVETDTVEHLFEFLPNVNANGTATITGTSLDNPTVTSTIVIYIIGQEIAASDTITPRFVGSPNAPSNIPNPCEASLELFIDTTGNKYLGFQWYYVSQTGDTAKVVSANKAEFRPVVQGNYFVQAFDSTYNYEYKSFPLTVSGPARPMIERPGEDDIEADTVLISTEADKYQWFVNGKLIKGANDKALRVFYNGIYYVSISDGKNCKTVSEKLDFNRTDFVPIGRAGLYEKDGIIENYGKPNHSLQLYPNPATDEFTIQYQSDSKRTINVQLFNTFGQEVSAKSYPYSKNQVRLVKFQILGMNSGLYYVKITDGDEVSNSKILIK